MLKRILESLVGYTPTTGLQFHCKIQEGVGPILWPVPRYYQK